MHLSMTAIGINGFIPSGIETP
ncbi:hypothetical protein Cabther_A0977 [Chloracidobacterium thermophilum B]|uniref:Uncharacterized protein n=1 Tax=Chloracidobacterium thermophilum (strain B) TaxID=981222 RepID=G2LFT9_CHLTF|nr:hypothetical protein Cabther_A0977 [Chloracidobacterium thermophilum B]